MSRAAVRTPRSFGTLILGAALTALTASAWLRVISDAASMPEMDMSPSTHAGAVFTFQWGVMMAAMMLPGAAPMMLLYRTVSRRLAVGGDRVLPATLFVTVYLLMWLALGVPVYGAHVLAGTAVMRWPRLDALVPYAIAALLAAAGCYQFTAAKRACLRHCESPLEFLMSRWRSGYTATLRLALEHAGYCVGCCAGLMAILVGAGAMSLPWVLAITVVVFAEKVLPRGWRTARLVGWALLVLAAAIVAHPRLATTMRRQVSPSLEALTDRAAPARR